MKYLLLCLLMIGCNNPSDEKNGTCVYSHNTTILGETKDLLGIIVEFKNIKYLFWANNSGEVHGNLKYFKEYRYLTQTEKCDQIVTYHISEDNLKYYNENGVGEAVLKSIEIANKK